MTTTLSDKKLEELYALLSVPMIDFDCGKECAPMNGGLPFCCDEKATVPLIFWDELRWHQRDGGFWRRMPKRGKVARDLADKCEDEFEVLAVCPGAAKCIRDKRALICRTFPLEPHCDSLGRVLGLTYDYSEDLQCPLVGREDVTFNPIFIRNCIRFWREILRLMPLQKRLYTRESLKLRRKFRKQGRKVPLFTARAV